MICPRCKGYVRNKPYIESVFDEKGNQKFTCRKCNHIFNYEQGIKNSEWEENNIIW